MILGGTGLRPEGDVQTSPVFFVAFSDKPVSFLDKSRILDSAPVFSPQTSWLRSQFSFGTRYCTWGEGIFRGCGFPSLSYSLSLSKTDFRYLYK